MTHSIQHSILTPGSAAKHRNANKPHYVYQFWSDTQCLYVGCTVQPAGRIGQHASSQPWWHYVTRIVADVYPCKEDGRLAESRLIHDLEPEWNWQQAEKGLGAR